MAFKKQIEKSKQTLTSQHFPGGGEQNQKKLAKIIIEAVANLNLKEYDDNLVRSKFQDFLESLGELDMHEIYDLAQALQGKTDCLLFFKCEEKDDKLEITYPYFDANTSVTKEEAKADLKYLEDKYMEGLDAESWYGYRQALEKTLQDVS